MFFITTPIYYVNDEPHLGHAYTTVLADVLARFHRLQGEPVFFLTGVDEHGQKVQNAVKKNGISDPQTYVDEMAGRFRAAWDRLEIRYDDFMRTTQPRHIRVVQSVLQRLWDAGQIYRADYEGWYCVPDERFWTEKDLLFNAAGAPVCPDCGRPVEKIIEANYFFRMSAYQSWLVEHIETHPEFIRPASRRNEVLGFLRKPLGDLCISRPAARLSWGIPLPFDPAYVTYVWFDALLNYVTAAGYLQDDDRFAAQWPNALHLIGKDILTTHAVYWPIMLQASGLPQPRTIFAHGWWVTASGEKMSKSLGNAVRPLDLAEIYGVDAFRYFLMRDMTLGQDADFAEERLAARYSADLANNLGNLLQRISQLIVRSFDGQVPQPGHSPAADELRQRFDGLAAAVFAQVNDFGINAALAQVMDALTAANVYLERCAPWTLLKNGQRDEAATALYTAGEALRLAAGLLWPVMPERAAEIWRRLGWTGDAQSPDALTWGGWQPGSRVTLGEPLFPRR